MKFSRIVPHDSFIGKYMEAAYALETAEAYDFWGAVWALGSCLGRDVYVPRPHAPVYMNWYVLLVAESGVTRKSTAVRMARDIVSHYLSLDNMIEGKCTPEYLFHSITKHPHTAISVSELVTFLGRDSYVVELPALLTDLYDCPKEKRGGSITRGEQVVRDAFVTFMSASTPTWLMGAVNPSVIEGGFTSRTMFVLDEKPKRRIAWPKDMMEMSVLHQLVADTVANAHEVGRIDLLPAGKQAFELWYRRRDVHSDSAFMASFLSREDAHVLRMAAILAINDGTLAISKGHIRTAIKVINNVKVGGMTIFNGGGHVVKVARGMDKMVRMLHDAGGVGVSHTVMYTAVRQNLTSHDFKVVVDYMNELGMLSVGIENRRGRGPKPRRYFRTSETVKQDRMQSLREALL